MGEFIQTNDIQLHYLDHPGKEPPIVLLHGLTANAHSFDGLVRAGLPNRLLAVDLRGRGLSEKPDSGYGLEDHAEDIIGLLDELGLDQVVLGGHSFGGLLTAYITAHYPERVSRCLLLDAGFLHPQVRELIQPSLDRLGQTVPSWEIYRDAVQAAPYWQGYWDAEVEAFYRADVQIMEDGRVKARTRPEAIIEAIDHALSEPWPEHMGKVQQPALMLNAPGAIGPPGTLPILPYEMAQETMEALPNCKYIRIPGNHFTMLYGPNAAEIVDAISGFIQ